MKGARPPLTEEEEARRFEEGFIADELNSINRAYDEETVEMPASLTRAHLYRRGGMNDQALSDHNEILKADPDDEAARIARASTLRDVGRLDDALCDYDDLLARAPDRVDARNGRAEVLRRQGRFEEALVEFEHVLAGSADDRVAGLSRAAGLTARGRHEEALRAYEALTTKDSETVFGRARALARMGRYHDALAELPYPPRDWRNYLARAMISLRASEFDAAEAVFELGARYLPTPEREPFLMALATVRLRSDDAGAGPSVVDVDLLDQTIAERTFRGY